MSARRKVLITGAAGTVGKVLADGLAADYELVLHGGQGRGDDDPEGLIYADIADYDEVDKLMSGVDTVVHLAGAASPESSWDAVLSANIIGLRHVLEAARANGVRRVVFASSNHAMGMYDRHHEWPVYPHMLPRPDSLYGVSKVFGETLGRFYHDEHDLDFISLRIGWSTGDVDAADLDLLRAMFLSEDDTVQVVRCAIEAEVKFGLYYAISDNPNRRWDMTNTMFELGYRPKDDFTKFSDEPEKPHEPTPEDWPKNS